jgi:WD40 repeat protein/energy-coupling factor transporter ATP-binding protein EcfA2
VDLASLFISHSSADRHEAERLAACLREWGYASLFLDADMEQGIAIGSEWERELYRQLRLADAVLFVGSAASAASSWCQIEIALARSQGKTIFPVALEPKVRVRLLDDRQWVDLTQGEAAYERLRRDLTAKLDPRDVFLWDAARAPYPGLTAFQRQDAAMFFGRDDVIEDVIGQLDASLIRGRCVAVIGPSGSGKSSLVRAGVVPRLSPTQWIVAPPFTPGDDPVGALAGSVAIALRSIGLTADHVSLREPAGFVAAIRDLGTTDGQQRWVLIVVDQAEELSLLASADRRAQLVRLLDDANSARARLCVLSTLRSEFLSAALADQALRSFVEQPVLVGPLDRSRLAEVILGPAHKAGIEFAPGLVERMVEDTRGGDALPLLAYTLRALYDRSGAHISAEDYRNVGGVEGSLTRHADSVAGELRNRALDAAVLPTLLRLVTVDAEGKPARRRILRSSLDEREQAVVDAFIDARLLVSSDNGAVEVAHEALLRAWTPLADAIDSGGERLRLVGELERDAREWNDNARTNSYLLRAERLARARLLLGGQLDDLNAAAREFYLASEQLEADEAAATRRRRRRTLVALSCAVIVLGVAAAISFEQYRAAQRSSDAARVAQRESLARSLVSQSAVSASHDTEQAALLSLQALRISAGKTVDARRAAISLMPSLQFKTRTIIEPTRSLSAFALSGDGRVVATASPGDVQTWDARTGSSLSWLRRGRGSTQLALSDDGSVLASNGSSNEAIRSNELLVYREGLERFGVTNIGDRSAIAMSADGKTSALLRSDGRLHLYRESGARRTARVVFGPMAISGDGRTVAVGDRERSRVIVIGPGGRHRLRMDAPSDVALSNDGGVLAAVRDGMVRLWRFAGRRPHEISLPSGGDAVALSSDGTTVATAVEDGSIRVWDTRTQQPLALLDHRGSFDVALSADGRTLASAGTDGAIRIWDFVGVAVSRLLDQPHVRDLAFSGDGDTLTTVGDWSVDITDWRTGKPLRRVDHGNGELALSTNGEVVATQRDFMADTIEFFDLRTRTRLPTASGTRLASALNLSGDGSVAAWSDGVEDERVRLWDVRRGIALKDIPASGIIFDSDMGLSSDGAILAFTEDDDEIELWDVRGLKELAPIRSRRVEMIGGFSPDGRTLLALDDQGVAAWSLAKRKFLGRLPITVPDQFAFSHDSSKAAIADSRGGAIWLWNLKTPSVHSRLPQPGVSNVVFSADDRTLASSGEPSGVQLWDVATRRPLVQLTASGADRLAFSPGGDALAAASANRDTTRVWFSILWSNRARDIRQWICRSVRRELTLTEWDEFLPGEPRRRSCGP